MPRLAPALALLALALAPAAAQAAHQHDLQLDKQEIFAEVPAGGAITVKRASCNSGYRVIQGSIRVDTVPGGSLASLRVRTSAPQNDRTWFYELVNPVPAGRQAAQIKLMISCLRTTTSGGSGNQHAIAFAARYDTSLGVAAGRQFGSGLNLDCAGGEPADSLGYIPAGAGWVFDPDAGYRQLASVQPTVAQASGGGGYFLGDSQDFGMSGNASQVAYTLYANVLCLRHATGFATGENSNHQHYLDASVQMVSRQFGTSSGGYWSQSVSCPSGSFAIAPLWDIDEAAHANGLRLVGIGYQGDQDVFRIVNPGGHNGFVSVGVICLGTKTSYTASPSPTAGPGPQRLLMTERSAKVTVGAQETVKRTLGCAGKTDYVTAGGIGGKLAGNVDVVRSGGGPKATRWPFVLRNPGNGDARVTLFVKCLSPWAEGHALSLAALPSRAPDGVAECEPGQIPIRPATEGDLTSDPRFTCLERITTQRINHHHRLFTKTVSGIAGGDGPRTLTCPKAHEAVTPSATPAKGSRLVKSIPNGRRWTFAFDGDGGKLSVTCLKNATTPEIADPIIQTLEGAES